MENCYQKSLYPRYPLDFSISYFFDDSTLMTCMTSSLSINSAGLLCMRESRVLRICLQPSLLNILLAIQILTSSSDCDLRYKLAPIRQCSSQVTMSYNFYEYSYRSREVITFSKIFKFPL